MRRLAAAAPYVFALTVATFIVLNLTIGLHPDDVTIIADSADRSYGELWTSPFLGRFYRPLVVTLVRLSLDVFGDAAIPLRVLQGALIAAILGTLLRTLRERGLVARYAAALYVLASPLTFVSISLFAVGVGDLIVGLMFVLAVHACLEPTSRPRLLIVYVVVALFSKESGVLVAAYGALEAGRRRQLVTVGAICAAVLGYLYVRTTFVNRSSFEFSTGYFFETYTPGELDRTFGEAPLRLYAYNIVANLANALTGFPERGELRLMVRDALLIPTMMLTTALVVRYLTVQRRWRALAPFAVLILLNALVGYAYVRSRIMFVGACSLAILLAFALDDLVTRPQRVFGITGRAWAVIAIALWIAVLVHTLARLRIQAAA